MQNDLKEVLAKLAERIASHPAGTRILIENSILFSASNFQTIKNQEKGKIAFVDGGNGEIAKAADCSVQLIRVFGSIHENGKRIFKERQEFIAVITTKKTEKGLSYNIETFNSPWTFNHDFDSFDITLREGVHRASIAKIGEVVRKFAEYKMAEKMLDLLGKGDLLVKDGALENEVTFEEEYLSRLAEKAANKEVSVCGVSKTTNLLTDTGHSASVALNKMAPITKWLYSPAAETKESIVSFAKMHYLAQQVYRIDTNKSNLLSTEQVIALLAKESNDLAFPGYPYGLIEADLFARVSGEECEQAKLRLMNGAFKKLKFNFESLNAHETLNKM